MAVTNTLSDNLRGFLSVAARYPLLNIEEERALLDCVSKKKRGHKAAAEKLLLSNLRLVARIAIQFRNCRIPVEDLASEGTIGLQLSIEKYKPGYNSKISTYASWWIKQRIMRYISNHSRIIRLPVHVFERNSKFSKLYKGLEAELGRLPTIEEICDATGLPVNRVEHLLNGDVTTVSLDSPQGDGDTASLADVVADSSCEDACFSAQKQSDILAVQSVLKEFPPREREIIKRRMGLNGDVPETLAVIGKTFGVTRERVRQIQAKVTKRIRQKIHGKDRIAEQLGGTGLSQNAFWCETVKKNTSSDINKKRRVRQSKKGGGIIQKSP